MDLGLEGKSVFVSASSNGLGLGAATRFAAEGANVAIASRSRENLDRARESILESTDCDPASLFAVEVDLAERDDIEAGIGATIDEFGGLDVLVTNHPGPANTALEETSLSMFDKGYNDVLRSVVIQCKAALPALRDGGGAITHNVSVAAEALSHATVANVFRPGIYGLSKTIANEEGEHGVRSNCVAPRGVRSDRIESKIAERAEREGLREAEVRELRVEELPLPDMGTTEEFGRAVAFVSSPAASYTTGAVLRVDGGWSRHML